MTKKEKMIDLFKKHPKHRNSKIADLAGVSTRYARMVKAEMISAARESLTTKVVTNKKKRVLVISDLHIPFEHPKALAHCKKLYKEYNCDTVVCIGDVVDQHAASRFASELEAMNVKDELEATKKALKPWIEAFPVLKLCLGNHDKIGPRQAKTVGIPEEYLKTFNQLYDLPDTWECAKTHEIDGCVYDHGVGSAGIYGAKNTAMKMGVSFIQGHTHQHGGVNYMARYDGKTIFGLNVGCLVSSGTYGTAYAADYRGKVTLGAGVVIEGEYGIFVPLNE